MYALENIILAVYDFFMINLILLHNNPLIDCERNLRYQNLYKVRSVLILLWIAFK